METDSEMEVRITAGGWGRWGGGGIEQKVKRIHGHGWQCGELGEEVVRGCIKGLNGNEKTVQ